MTHMRISVIIPAYNEDIEIMRDLVSRLRELGAEPLIVSNVPLPEDLPHIVRPGRIGYGNAIKEGLRVVEGPAAYMDADGTYDPSDLQKALPLLKNGVDLVIVRRLRGKFGRPSGMTLSRYILNMGIHVLFFIFSRRWIDTQSGFKVMSGRMREILLNESREGGMTFSLETILIAIGNSLRFEEVQGTYLPRRAGRSKVRVRDILQIFLLTVKFFVIRRLLHISR